MVNLRLYLILMQTAARSWNDAAVNPLAVTYHFMARQESHLLRQDS